MNPARILDLENRWRPIDDPQERLIAQSLLDDAWEEIVLRVPRIEQRLTDTLIAEGLVIRVVAAMVLRVLQNPEGIRQESLGEYTYVRDQALSAGYLYATDEEIRLLTDGAPRPRAMSMPV